LAAGFAPLSFLFARLPYLNAIVPSRWLPAAGLCLVLVGALGLETVFRREIGRGGAAVSILIPAAAILLLAQPPRLLAVLLLAIAPLFARFRSATQILLAVALLDLIPWALDYLPTGHREMLYPATPFMKTVQDHARAHPGSRVTSAGFLVYPSILPVYGLAEVRVNNPAADIRYLRVLDAALGFRPEERRYKGALTNVDSPLLRFLGLSVLISSRHAPKPEGWIRLDHNEFAPMRLLGNPDPLPRWFLPTGAVMVPPAEPWKAVAALEDPRRVVLTLPGWRPPERPWDPGAVRWQGGRGRLRLEFPAGGWKLIASSVPYSEGWTAEARGRRPRIVPVNAAFLGVVAGPGTGAAELRFEPPGFRTGLALCAAALLLGAALRGGVRRGARPTPPRPPGTR
ncbi:MAG TPA: YfhO family protein, partial [Thermoanaerobaculia bacterium]